MPFKITNSLFYIIIFVKAKNITKASGKKEASDNLST